MKRIEQFNQDINLSDETRFDRWLTYRNQIVEFIDPYLSLKEKEKCLILGSGNCDDLDLSYIIEKYRDVTLSDIDLSSVKKGILKQNLKINQFKLIKEDFSGFDKINFFENLIDDVLTMKTEDEILDYLIKKVKLSQQITTFENIKEIYDFIWISPIFTQLIFNQVLKATEVLREMKFDPLLIQVIESSMLNLMPEIIDHFNQKIDQVSKKDSMIVVLSDIFQSKYNDAFELKIKQAIHSTDLMDLLYKDYQETYGYGLGDYGLLSLSASKHLLAHRWFLWPFSESINMTVECLILENKKG
ncbi:MAG: hypothetical protein JXC31_00680 [Acholeplasmataceae bacterium]|nr:hypothetical protein [Acholeplasmataceae bacterium]